jgi:catechol 2,3-dioxygenase-like lactoylglutathione lyase family enzyme
MKALLEVVTLPDPDRSLRFYRDKVGFALDVDYAPTPDFRVIQLTPEGASTSIQFGVGLTDAQAGSVRQLRRFPRSRRQHMGAARAQPPVSR